MTAIDYLGPLIVCTIASLFVIYAGWRSDTRSTVVVGVALIAATWLVIGWAWLT